MHTIFRRSRLLTEFSGVYSRSLSQPFRDVELKKQCTTATESQLPRASRKQKKWKQPVTRNWVTGKRNRDLGRTAYGTFVVKSLVGDERWDVSQINDLVQGLSKRYDQSQSLLRSVNSLDEFRELTDIRPFFARIGELYLNDQESEANDLISTVHEKFMADVPDKVKEMIIKLQHPRFVLKEICEQNSLEIGISITARKDTKTCEATVMIDGEMIVTTTGFNSEKAQDKACCEALLCEKLYSEFEKYQLDSMTCPLDDTIDLDIDSPKERVVTVEKLPHQPFGFTLCGGDAKVIKDEEYIQKHIMSPIFIKSIVPDSPAEQSGLRVGDVLIGVNDYSLDDITHKQAVLSIQKFVESAHVEFTVKYSMDTKKEYEMERVFFEREKRQLKEEINTTTYGKWHHAKSKEVPEDYLLERLKEKEKKKWFVGRRGRKSIRLWEY